MGNLLLKKIHKDKHFWWWEKNNNEIAKSEDDRVMEILYFQMDLGTHENH